jgi:hypothetical protein
MIITIHQPNFFPWYPLFQKIEEADKFVFLNNAQFQKNNLQNRFNFNDKWHTLSVNSGLESITTKKYINPVKDWNRIKSNLSDYLDVLSQFDDLIKDNLVETNTKIVERICGILDIKTEILLDYPTKLTSTDRIVDICLHYKADTYLSGISGRNYLELNKFEENGIKIIFQDESKMVKKSIIEIIKNKKRYV